MRLVFETGKISIALRKKCLRVTVTKMVYFYIYFTGLETSDSISVHDFFMPRERSSFFSQA